MTGPFFKRHYNQIRGGWYFNRSWDKVYLHYVAIFRDMAFFFSENIYLCKYNQYLLINILLALFINRKSENYSRSKSRTAGLRSSGPMETLDRRISASTDNLDTLKRERRTSKMWHESGGDHRPR